MADLIELDVVVRNKGLKESISTTERLERQIIKASKALDQNRISQERYNKILLSAKREYEALGLKSQKATAQVRRFADAQRDLSTAVNAGGVAAQQTARKTNQLGVLMQQTGYQVGDFAVQVQSGTNVMVALGQQATQLVGTFAMLARSTAAIAAFSALGVIVPIVTAIAGAFMRTAKSAEEAEEKVSGLAKTLKDFRQEQRALTQGITTDQLALQDRIRAIKELQEGYLQVLKDINEENDKSKIMNVDLSAAERFGGLFGSITSRFEGADVEEKIRLLGDLLVKAAAQEQELQIKINTEYLKRVRSMEEANKLAAIENRFGQDHVKYRNEVRRQAEVALELEIKQAGITDLVARKLRDRLKFEYDLIDAKADQDELDRLALARQEAITNSTKAALAVTKEMTSAIEDREAAVKEIQKTHNDELQSLKNQIELIKIEAQYGKDSLELEKATAAQAREAYEQSRIDAGMKGNLLELEMATYDELQRQKKTLEDINEEEIKRLAAVTLRQKMMDKQYSGRGGDPRKQGSDYMQSLEYQTVEEIIEELTGSGEKAARAMEELNDKIRELEDAADPFREYNRELEDLDKLLKAGKISQQAYNKAVDDLNEGLGDSIQIIGDVEQAFSDWMSRGFDDFKTFVGDILNSFKQMLVDMAAAALRNKILIPITTGMAAGFGSSAAASTMASGTGSFASGTMGASLAAGASAMGSGFMAGVQGFMGGGISGYGATLSATAANAGTMATIGAALPAVIAVAAVVGLLTKKTKLLDSGLRATVEGFDVAIETFQLTQSSRLFGLLKGSKVTSYEAADAELADPLIKAIGDMQQSIVDAAGTLGIGADAFDNFSYQFKLSLQGLTEEEKLQKINEEITKMGDSFASLSGHFETMNELLAAATQRYDLETRVLQLLGNETELLIRQRERERAATHELNRGMLDQVYALEDAYSAVNSAFATVQRSIEARKAAITSSFNDIMDAIQGRLAAAQSAVGVSGGILSSLEGASGTSGMTRGAGLAYLRSLRGASRISDQKKLDDALQAIAEPSEGLYTNFVDYQRDFADQRNLIRELEEKAGHQLSTDEQTLLEIQNEADAAQARYDGQIDKLDEQLAQAQEQLNALYGINTSVKDVSAAIADLSAAVQAALSAQAAAKAALAGAGTGGGAGAGVQEANAAGQQILNQLGQSGIAERKSDGAKFQKVNIRGSSQLLQVASDLGVQTSGKTGAQIQQAISNAGNLGVNMDNATRALQFAMGGNFGGGLRMVGERGPELEATGPSRIFSTKQTAELFRNPELVAEVRSLREEVAGLRTESRQLQASNSKYVKRNYDINRKWDTEGLPATRT
jgi:hypothetical protein